MSAGKGKRLRTPGTVPPWSAGQNFAGKDVDLIYMQNTNKCAGCERTAAIY